MISIEEFYSLVRELLQSDLNNNPAQRDSIGHEGNDILMLVAGPGSGKTRVLVLRALRHVLVDDVLPENLLITTFTRKAAKELRTRWLDWGTLFLESLGANFRFQEMIRKIDLNRCRIDTLDSIAQQALTDNRLPGEIAPILMEGAASKLILKRTAFGSIYTANQNELDQLFSRYTFEGNVPRNRGEALAVAKTLCDRFIQDRVNLDEYRRANTANQIMVDILSQYYDQLRETNLFDFAILELKLLERLQDGSLSEWVDSIKCLLIDEYQDTNPLQEAIYFEIIAAASPLTTIVGDDDQSMYRFRGGSVELFTQFEPRCFIVTNKQTRRIDMVINYRSSEEIVNFYNSHIAGDSEFIPARIVPAKPEVISNRGLADLPILGMFRPNPTDLADALSDWIDDFLTNRRFVVDHEDFSFELRLQDEGDLGDLVLLAHNIQEIKYNRFNGNADIRFAGHFRNAMMTRGRHVFNPRGRSLRIIHSVQQLLGLLLLCVDPDDSLINQVYPTNEARFFLTEWRTIATNLIAQNPFPSDSGGLSGFIARWQNVSRGFRDLDFPPDWPALELIFKLITWIPNFQSDPEHQVWLEAITRIVANTSIASPYGMLILQNGRHRDLSRQSLIRDALLPIAENEVDVDEDIMPSVPRNHLQLMTIHQAKGLEFPLVIVDVGSQFTMNHPLQRFLRFPENPSNVVRMEDDVEPFLNAPLRNTRGPMNRTFDDLVRLYYVAFSRPQSVLILIGCENCLRYGREGLLTDGAIPNIALGWTRSGSWPWRQAYSGRRRPIRVDPPLFLI